MGKIVCKQMPAPRELPQQIPAPGQKLGCKSPRVGENFWCKSPGVRGGGNGYGWNWYLHYKAVLPPFFVFFFQSKVEKELHFNDW